MSHLQGYFDYETYYGAGLPDATKQLGGTQQYCITTPSQTDQTQTVIADLDSMFDKFEKQISSGMKQSHNSKEKCEALGELNKKTEGYNPFAIQWDSDSDTCQVVRRPEKVPSLCVQRTLAGGYVIGPVPEVYCGAVPAKCSNTDWYGHQIPEPRGPDPNWWENMDTNKISKQ